LEYQWGLPCCGEHLPASFWPHLVCDKHDTLRLAGHKLVRDRSSKRCSKGMEDGALLVWWSSK
jgi:hypothetical protein